MMRHIADCLTLGCGGILCGSTKRDSLKSEGNTSFFLSGTVLQLRVIQTLDSSEKERENYLLETAVPSFVLESLPIALPSVPISCTVIMVALNFRRALYAFNDFLKWLRS